MAASPPQYMMEHKSSRTFYRIAQPLIMGSGLLDLYAAYLSAHTKSIPNRQHHISSNLFAGYANFAWGLGGLIRYEYEVPIFLKLKSTQRTTVLPNTSVLSAVSKRRIPVTSDPFATSTRIYRVSLASLFGLTGHHVVFGMSAWHHGDHERASAHLAAGLNTASYTYVWRSIFLERSRRALTPFHLSAIACMAYIWWKDRDRILRFTHDYPLNVTERKATEWREVFLQRKFVTSSLPHSPRRPQCLPLPLQMW